MTDSAGNTYTLSFPATVGTGFSQAIYYAKNIATAASNTVTVTFNVPAASPDIRILEYSGLDLVSPLDDTNGLSGNGTVLDSGIVFTSVAGDLLVGASMSGGTVITTSPIFTTVATTPSGISVEHLVGPAAGPFDAISFQDSSANWVMQAVAFRQAGTVPDFTISVTPPNTATVAAGSSATYTVSVSCGPRLQQRGNADLLGSAAGHELRLQSAHGNAGGVGRDLGTYHHDHCGYAARDFYGDRHRNFRIFEPRHHRKPDRDCGFCDCSHRPYAVLGGGGIFRHVDRHHHSDGRFHGHGHSVLRQRDPGRG